MGFTHLHVHTEYSLLDGAARIKDVVAKARELGMTSLAITDHGVMFGVIDFYRECIKNGIKPIIGCEVYTAARTMDDKDAEKDKHQGHLVLLAKDNTGYHNLIKIVSESIHQRLLLQPRVDKEHASQIQRGNYRTFSVSCRQYSKISDAEKLRGCKAGGCRACGYIRKGQFLS